MSCYMLCHIRLLAATIKDDSNTAGLLRSVGVEGSRQGCLQKHRVVATAPEGSGC